MSLAELADLASQTAISGSRKPVPTDGLWTSRNPVFLPPSLFPGQPNNSIPTDYSSLLLPWGGLKSCANESGDVYLYGGFGDRGNELYHYSATDNTITPFQCWGDSPGGRFCHAMAIVGNIIAIHGADVCGQWGDADLYLLNLISRKWSRIPTSGSEPGPLRGHAMAVVGMAIYIFGGYDSDDVASNKLWAFNLDTLRAGKPTWELVEPSSQERPAAQYDIVLVSYRDRLILFGGYEDGYLGDVWSFDTKSRSWTELQCTGDIPFLRAGHAVAMVDDVMYVTGGCDYGKTIGVLVGDTFALKIPEQRWVELENTDTIPIPRSFHVSACIGTNIFIFGGVLRGAPEEHWIHILDLKYIDNSNLHTPERLKELDTIFEERLLRKKLERRMKEIKCENERMKRNLITPYILEHPSIMDSLAQLQSTDAQAMVDFLADELGHQDILLSSSDRRHFLHLLIKLAKSAQVFPKCTELSGVQCTLSNPTNDEGGYGFIYKGVFKGQPVCVKAVRVVGYGSKPSKMLRAQAGEVVLLAHISHPNVIPLYGAYLSDEEIPRICVVSPWMENGDLTTYLGKFPDTPKIPLVFDTAVGLNFLHDMGIIHADLKAANVLVSRSRRAMLADFGISTVLHTSVGTTTAGDFAGTAYWMAPELLCADELSDDRYPPPTKQGDMWGFACICYEVLTGEIPFIKHYSKPIRLVMAFMKGHRITPLRPTRDSDPIVVDGGPLVTIAERCWNHDPNERPTAAEALRFFNELNVQDDRPPMDEETASFEAVKGSRVKVEVDYSRVLSIIQKN